MSDKWDAPIQRAVESIPRRTYLERYEAGEDNLRELFEKADAQLSRLVEENEQQAKDAAQVVGEYIEDIARLRERVKELEHAAGNYTPGLFDEVVAERDRLREQGGLLTEQVMHMDNELASLREENERRGRDLAYLQAESQDELARLRELLQDFDAWRRNDYATQLELTVLFDRVRNALKETT